MEDVGISPNVIRAKRDFIIEWFKVAVVAGQLEEDLPADLGYNPSQENTDARRKHDRTIGADHPVGSRAIGKGRSGTELTTGSPADGASRIALQSGPECSVSEMSSTRESALPTRRPPSIYGLSYFIDVLRGSSIKDAKAKAKAMQQSKLLHQAVAQGSIALVRWYLNDMQGIYEILDDMTALDKAILVDDTALAKILLGGGANPNGLIHISHSGIRVPYDYPVLYTVKHSRYEMTESLLEHGADINKRDELGSYPLINATLRSDVRMIQLLIDDRFDININARGEHERTALIIATHHKDTTTVALLINDRNDIDVNARDEYGQTALIIATAIGYVDGVRILLDKGANATIKSNNPYFFGHMALAIAQYSQLILDRSAIIELLRNAEALASGNVKSTLESNFVDRHP